MITNLLNQLPKLPYFLKAVLILGAGILLLRFSGKRAIAQMTVPEVVLMIAVGTILIQPLGGTSEWNAIYGGAILIAGMILVSKIQIWFPKTRKYLYGVPSVIIKNGSIDVKELKKMRMTTNELEMRLRQLGTEGIADVEMAVLEPSGSLSVIKSVIKKENKKIAEKGDIQRVVEKLELLLTEINKQGGSTNIINPKKAPLFEEALKESNIKDNITLH